MNLFSLSLLLEAYATVQVRKLFTEKVIYCGLTQNLFYIWHKLAVFNKKAFAYFCTMNKL